MVLAAAYTDIWRAGVVQAQSVHARSTRQIHSNFASADQGFFHHLHLAGKTNYLPALAMESYASSPQALVSIHLVPGLLCSVPANPSQLNATPPGAEPHGLRRPPYPPLVSQHSVQYYGPMLTSSPKPDPNPRYPRRLPPTTSHTSSSGVALTHVLAAARHVYFSRRVLLRSQQIQLFCISVRHYRVSCASRLPSWDRGSEYVGMWACR